MLHFLTDGLLIKYISVEISMDIFLLFFFYLSLPYFSKRLIDKQLSDYYPNHFMLHNPATQQELATLQRVDYNRNLNLNKVFGHSKSPIMVL